MKSPTFPAGRFLRQGAEPWNRQAPVKKYNEYLRDLIVNGRAKPSQIVSHHIRIDEVPNAYDKFDKRIDGYTKVLIKFGETKKAA